MGLINKTLFFIQKTQKKIINFRRDMLTVLPLSKNEW